MRVIRMLSELEFFSLVKRLRGGAGGGSADPGRCRRQGAAAPQARCLEPPVSRCGPGRQRMRRHRCGGRRTFTAEDWLSSTTARGRGAGGGRSGQLPRWSAAARRADRGDRHRDHAARAARGRADRTVARGEPERGLVPPVRPPAARRRAGRAGAGAEPAAAHRFRAARRSPPCSPTPRCPRRATTSSTTGRCCGAAGVELRGVAYDSMLASFVLDPGRRSHAIDTLSPRASRPRDADATTTWPGRGRSQIPFAEVAIGCGGGLLRRRQRDRARPARVLRAARSVETATEPLLREIEMPLVEVLTDMEWEGIRDRPRAVRPPRAPS